MSPKIMILTASYGDGHIHASRALKQSFAKAGIDQVIIIDLMKEAHPILNKISRTLYLKSSITSQYGLDYYGWSYYMTRDTKPDVAWNRYFNILGKKKLKEIIEQERPDAVISTFPFGSAPLLCRRFGIPTFTVVTDFALHTRWLNRDINKYYVATEELKEQMVSNGVSRQRIQVSGIPVRKQFADHEEREAGKAALQWAGQPKTILILAGSYGFKYIEEMIHNLQAVEDSQIVIVCGRNTKLEQKLRMKYTDQPHLYIFGFIDHIHEIMSISSCLVTKAGGITLSEALALKLPCFIFKPFAGQEKENAIFLSSKQVASVSNSPQELAFQIRHFFSEDIHSAEIKKRVDLIQKKTAADFIVKDLLQTITGPEYASSSNWPY
jgi:processive 1,2-diacylglycerol beta-glucosyltransferase